MARTVFGTDADGAVVERLLLGAGDLSAAILTRGAVLNDLRLAGTAHSLTVGSPDLAAYEGRMASCGAIVGPVANRIAGAAAEIDGTQYRFARNLMDRHTLHGGDAALHLRNWQIVDHGADHVTLALDLPDGEGGFPGNRRIEARYTVAPPAVLRLTLTATTDAPTLMNVANHSYWRLDDAPTTEGHVLRIDADRYTPVDDDLIPTGKAAPVDGTRFDFRAGRVWTAGKDGSVDHNFCLSDARTALRPVAWLEGRSGVRMEMSTTEPGLQIFDGFSLDVPQFTDNDGAPPVPYCGIAMEAQFWPDAPHHPGFPSILLRPGEQWRQVTQWRFERG